MLSAISSMSLEDYFLLLKVQNEIKKIRQVYLLYRLLHLAIVMAIIFLFSILLWKQFAKLVKKKTGLDGFVFHKKFASIISKAITQ